MGSILLFYKWVKYVLWFFYVLLTVHLSIFFLVINQLDAQTYCKTKFCASSWLITKINVLWYLRL